MGSPIIKNLRVRTMFSENIRHYLKERGWSEAELGRKAGISQKQVNNIVRERFGCSVEAASEIGKALKIPFYQLLIPGRAASDAAESALDDIIQAYLKGDSATRTKIRRAAR